MQDLVKIVKARVNEAAGPCRAQAYSVLMDEAQRGLYDQQLDVALQDQEDGYTGRSGGGWVGGQAA